MTRAVFGGHGATRARSPTRLLHLPRTVGRQEASGDVVRATQASGDNGKAEASEDSSQEVATKVTDSKTKARSGVLTKHSGSNLKQRIYLTKTKLWSATWN